MAVIEVATIQRLGIGRFHCTHMSMVVCNRVGTFVPQVLDHMYMYIACMCLVL